MINLIVGLGNQGIKRKFFFKKDELISYDTKNKLADYNSLNDIPIKKISSAYLCSPDNIKNSLIKFFLNNNKNILVEKPCLLSKKNFNFIRKKIKKKKNNLLYSL
jgi:scyllo-inositol 2-dehydrogenase (NADP+)